MILKPSGVEAVLCNVRKRTGDFYAKYLGEKYGVKNMDLILLWFRRLKP
jgi:hypothetical protein